MGFTIYYRTTRPISATEAKAIEDAANAANEGRSWLSSECVWFFSTEPDGHLLGGSKPNFQPAPEEVEMALLEGLPDGTPLDVLEILCKLSREHGVDWELSHSEGPMGSIRAGECDEGARSQAAAFVELMNTLAEETEGFMGEEIDD